MRVPRGLARGAEAAGEEQADTCRQLPEGKAVYLHGDAFSRRDAAVERRQHDRVEHAHEGERHRGDDAVIVGRRARVGTVHEHAERPADGEHQRRQGQTLDLGRLPRPALAPAGGEADGNHEHRRAERPLQRRERLGLLGGERREHQIEHRRDCRSQKQQRRRRPTQPAIASAAARAAMQGRGGEHGPGDDQQLRVEDLQHVTAAPEQFLVEPIARRLAGQQHQGDGETRQRDQIDHRRNRHRCDEPTPAAGVSVAATQVDQQAERGQGHTRGEHDEAGVIQRIDDRRHVVVERGLAAIEQRRDEEQRCGQADGGNRRRSGARETRPAGIGTRPGTRPGIGRPRRLGRRQHEQGAEHRQEPDDEREHHVDHQALVEEADGPREQRLDTGNARDGEKQREHAGERQGTDGEQRPRPEFGPRPIGERPDVARGLGARGFGGRGLGGAGGRDDGLSHGHGGPADRGTCAPPSHTRPRRTARQTSRAARSSGPGRDAVRSAR